MICCFEVCDNKLRLMRVKRNLTCWGVFKSLDVSNKYFPSLHLILGFVLFLASYSCTSTFFSFCQILIFCIFSRKQRANVWIAERSFACFNVSMLRVFSPAIFSSAMTFVITIIEILRSSSSLKSQNLVTHKQHFSRYVWSCPRMLLFDVHEPIRLGFCLCCSGISHLRFERNDLS